MKLFECDLSWWEDKNAGWTAKEIAQQPSTWMKTLNQMQEVQPALDTFINDVTKREDFDIVFAGAGTSEFAGNAIYPWLAREHDWHVHSYASTDLTSDPQSFINPQRETLMVSFGRSGNSPESSGSVDTVNAWSDHVKHLFITCNKNGDLALRAENDPSCFEITLADETHDQSFAMTSSFSNMSLAALLAFSKGELEEYVPVIAQKVSRLLESDYKVLDEIVNTYDFNRIVYLGSSGLKGTAQESALKMSELTAGEVDTVFDTPMGFRHGPKSVINDNTLTVVYLSDDPYTRQYELDIIEEMGRQKKGNKILVLSSKPDTKAETYADWFISLDNGMDMPFVMLGLEYIVAAQLLALFKSVSMGHTPDNPCPTGEVNRVVQGVTIYPFTQKGDE